ncbi:GerAB/ArcD/ProY family transporter [Paenibacillus sp. BSR1-1]|uniref:GerAB/ArcD/ProY family transporter n=1 Tax=Paenibacillus sp. BSR1-1 TaxID=3020845 RepID=UPI0025B0857B|nr:GerAB/ArcD/ProY family transporter [Paenibacillus sp. BSR1-1]MDN3015987.1 GerAB/ArcD/ProY family transporter [Paenibacillus sp. BSR1-1]
MTRHFFYIVMLTMMLNIILNVPMVLVQDRFHGSIISIVISIIIGSLFIFLFIIGMSRFPKKGLPEIFHEKFPAYIRNPYLVFLGIMWMASGTFALVSYSYVVKLYLNPEMNLLLILGFLLFIIIFGASKKTDSILYLTEIIIVIAAPMVAFILFKAITSKFFYFDHIKRMGHFIWQIPSYSSISAATYIFIGYINLAIVNRFIDSRKLIKVLWTLPIIGIFVLCSTFFIPMGFLGVNGVNDVVFPWIFITDSLRMEFGFIERVLYLTLCLYLLLVLLFGIITWHIGLKLLEGVFIGKNTSAKTNIKREKLFTFVFLIGMGVLTLILQAITNQRQFFYIVKLWLNIRFPAEFMLVVLVYLISRRQKA